MILNDDLHSSSWLDDRVLLADVGCLKACDPSMCWEFIRQIATSTYQHLLVAACRRVEDLAMVHLASGRSGALGLRSALRFAGLLTQEGTVPARP